MLGKNEMKPPLFIVFCIQEKKARNNNLNKNKNCFIIIFFFLIKIFYFFYCQHINYAKNTNVIATNA